MLVLDNATWHKVKTLTWHHFEALFLPPDSPDFNPIERLWLRLKADFFADWIARSGAELEDRHCRALNHFLSSLAKTASNCSIRKGSSRCVQHSHANHDLGRALAIRWGNKKK